MNYTVHGILQARILEWVALPISKDLPNPGIKPRSPTLQADSFPVEPQGKSQTGKTKTGKGRQNWKGNSKPLQYSCLENTMNTMKIQKDMTLKLPRSEGAQNVTGDEWRNNSRKNEAIEPKQKQYPEVDVTGDRSKV